MAQLVQAATLKRVFRDSAEQIKANSTNVAKRPLEDVLDDIDKLYLKVGLKKPCRELA